MAIDMDKPFAELAEDHLKTPGGSNSALNDGLCADCGGIGEMAVFDGDGRRTAENVRIVFCKCDIGKQKAKEQSETLNDHGA